MILRAKYLITGDGRTCLQDQAVYLDKEGKIGWIGDAAEAAGRYPEEMVKDYGEATILPGLFDMHVHFGYYYSQPDLDNYDDYMVAYYALEQAKQSLRFGRWSFPNVQPKPTGCSFSADRGKNVRHVHKNRRTESRKSDVRKVSPEADQDRHESPMQPPGQNLLHDLSLYQEETPE